MTIVGELVAAGVAQHVGIGSVAEEFTRPGRTSRGNSPELIDSGLASYPPSSQQAEHASTLAARDADRVADKTMPLEEQERRKRAVIKGPKEFRDIREDLPGGKKS